MIYETIQLTACETKTKLIVYAPDNHPEIDEQRTRPAVVLCAGGAYAFRSFREAEPIALQLMAADVCVFMLEYAVAPARYPTALTQLAAAVQYVRKHAQKYHVKSDKIVVMGFSAGGHLAASLGVRWNEAFLAKSLKAHPSQLRPNGMILCYPVITGGTFTHEGSMKNLTGEEDADKWECQSLEQLVSSDTPPVFLWHTYSDPSVPVENSMLFFSALRKHGVNAELHIYPKGGHGLSLCNSLTSAPNNPESIQPAAENWLSMAIRWLKDL